MRYWEDAEVDGVPDIDYDECKAGTCPRVPCAKLVDGKYRWCIDIDAETGIILNWVHGVTADIHYKVCDDCEIDYVDTETGYTLCNNDGFWYCPDFLAAGGGGYGDYIIFKVDADGKISPWSHNLVNEWYAEQTRRDDV